MIVDWTDKKISEVLKLWIDGLSARQIALRMAHNWKMRVTKNMIIGAMNRYGRNIERQIPKHSVKPKPKPIPKMKAAPKPVKIGGRRVKEVVGKSCLYIHGEPSGRKFCGAPAVMDIDVPQTPHSWCAEHLNMIFMPRVARASKVPVRKDGRVDWITRPSKR